MTNPSRASHISARANWSVHEILGIENDPLSARRTDDRVADPFGRQRPQEVEGAGKVVAERLDARQAAEEVAADRGQDPEAR
jgi:hypothetical protein